MKARLKPDKPQSELQQFLIDNSIWKVLLSNNETVLSDNDYKDDKPDWLRLKEYCLENNLSISKMWLCFRDHHILIPEAKHYYFRRMALGSFGKNNRPNQTYLYFMAGSTNNKQEVHIYKYLVPELNLWEEEDRKLDENDISLI